ncbi:hypothetical protein SDC9_208510 [bioreactor metagenome]|uniref:Uncharacterized protein n=1 Tax=bioreactor metagenome TaxID=1076179 RepID=A0A645JAU5_9ZZZZ
MDGDLFMDDDIFRHIDLDPVDKIPQGISRVLLHQRIQVHGMKRRKARELCGHDPPIQVGQDKIRHHLHPGIPIGGLFGFDGHHDQAEDA